MEKSYKKTIEVKKTVEIVIDEYNLGCLISNAMADTCGFDWWSYDEKAYEEARSELISEIKPDADDQICLEDILARMLLKGGKLKLLEPESGWHWSGKEPDEMVWKAEVVAKKLHPVGGKWHAIGIDDVARGIGLYGEAKCASDCGADIRRIVEDGDFYDADAVFQFAAYGEIVFG